MHCFTGIPVLDIPTLGIIFKPLHATDNDNTCSWDVELYIYAEKYMAKPVVEEVFE